MVTNGSIMLVNKNNSDGKVSPLKNVPDANGTAPHMDTFVGTLKNFNDLPNIKCFICRGYIIDATTSTKCPCTCEFEN